MVIGEEAKIARDAMLSGGYVANAGQVTGNLSVRAETFDNAGTAGHLDVRLEEPRQGLSHTFVVVFDILLFIGMFVLGILLLAISPKRFFMVEKSVRRSAFLTTLVGFVTVILSVVVLILLAVTVILLPVALAGGMLYFIALLFSTLFVSASLGRIIAGYLNWGGEGMADVCRGICRPEPALQDSDRRVHHPLHRDKPWFWSAPVYCLPELGCHPGGIIK